MSPSTRPNPGKVRDKWSYYGEGTRLVILNSPYRLLVEPLMDYIQSLLAAAPPE